MNGDNIIHTFRLWSVSAFIKCTNLQGFIYFSLKCKNVLQAKHALWASKLSVFFDGGGGVGTQVVMCHSFHLHPNPPCITASTCGNIRDLYFFPFSVKEYWLKF